MFWINMSHLKNIECGCLLLTAGNMLDYFHMKDTSMHWSWIIKTIFWSVFLLVSLQTPNKKPSMTILILIFDTPKHILVQTWWLCIFVILFVFHKAIWSIFSPSCCPYTPGRLLIWNWIAMVRTLSPVIFASLNHNKYVFIKIRMVQRLWMKLKNFTTRYAGQFYPSLAWATQIKFQYILHS